MIDELPAAWDTRVYGILRHAPLACAWEGEAEDGFRIVIERWRPSSGGRPPCDAPHPKRDVRCIAPERHDGPHVPASRALLEAAGPLVITRISSR